jgi:hypothetical protein
MHVFFDEKQCQDDLDFLGNSPRSMSELLDARKFPHKAPVWDK